MNKFERRSRQPAGQQTLPDASGGNLSPTSADVIAISTSFRASIYTTAATLGLGQLQEADNQLSLAAETYGRALMLAGDPPRPMACEAHLGLARISYQWNDLDVAEQHGGVSEPASMERRR